MNELKLREEYGQIDDATKIETLRGINKEKDAEIRELREEIEKLKSLLNARKGDIESGNEYNNFTNTQRNKFGTNSAPSLEVQNLSKQLSEIE